ncbi:SDR family oxidoreductase [Microbispora hainanensis]|uniref:SDR family NAD(P)-dependent oxidoreductase n=1 Tax=Microbispora hainanensis TaxID=568844 RepID=A0A544YVB0_9ACTN|nr:SDR family NAD(P)-dependent oxidoreductase [Microbispora hainanensis]TQS20704.1 SDR family NAD(P)-dependent oxidoreductase [Microbispora hainanensis]
MEIQGKTVLVAGATSGLGLGVARHFIERRANVVLLGRRAELAQKHATDLGSRALGVGADITDPKQVEAAIEAAIDRFGTIDINVNTAGYIVALPLVTAEGTATQVSEFSRLMNTNVIGTFNVMSQSAAVMLNNAPGEDGERGVILPEPSAPRQARRVRGVRRAHRRERLLQRIQPAPRRGVSHRPVVPFK